MIKCVSCEEYNNGIFQICVHVLEQVHRGLIFDGFNRLVSCHDCYYNYAEGNNSNLIYKPICYGCLEDSGIEPLWRKDWNKITRNKIHLKPGDFFSVDDQVNNLNMKVYSTFIRE